MLFHSPLASSSCPFMVKWKQSWVKNVISIFPFCPERWNMHKWRLTDSVCWWNVTSLQFAATCWQSQKLHLSHSGSSWFSCYCVMFSPWFICCGAHIVLVFGGRRDYREARRVGMFQKGLKNNSKVVPEETVAVEQLFQSFLWTDRTQKSIYLPFLWFRLTAVIRITYKET